jgi:hypothetical protein
MASNATIAREKGAVQSTEAKLHAPLRPLDSCLRRNDLVSKDRRVLLLDLGHLRHHAGRIVGEQLDLRKRRAAPVRESAYLAR